MLSLAAPLGLLAAALAVPLALWYLLRTRRPRVTVASTWLWRSSNQAVTSAVPWQRFHPDRTFWLALLAILVGALALARPALPAEEALSDHTIVIFDASASMLADEDGPTRLELARRAAERLLAGLGPGQRVSVIEAAARARVVLSGSGDASAVRRALGGLRPSQGAADYVDAFTLATALQRPGQSTSVALFTDGVVPPEQQAAAPPDLQIVAVGVDRPNLAVTRLQAVPAGGGATEVFVQVRNFGPLPVDARLVLATGQSALDTRILELNPRGTQDVVASVTLPAAEAAVLRASVEPVGEGAGDALAVDDTAFAVVTGGGDLSALVAGPGNVFIESALGVIEGVEVRTALSVPSDLTGIDLLVVDRVAAPAQLSVPTMTVAAQPLPDGVVAGPPVELPSVTFQAPEAELLRDVDLAGLAVASAQPLESAVLTPLVGGPAGTLVAAGRLGGQPLVALGFDLTASNLPLQVAWPVLMANVVNTLVGPPVAVPVVAGSTVDLAVPAGATDARMVSPSGDTVLLDPASARVRLDEVGVWRPSWGEGEAPLPLAVNAVAGESDLARQRPSPAEQGPDRAAATTTSGRRVVGAGLLAAVLVLLMGEWALSHGVRPLRRLRGRRVRVGA